MAEGNALIGRKPTPDFDAQSDPDFLIRDMLKTMTALRATLISQLANRHRIDGQSDFGLMKTLVIVDGAIAAVRKGVDDA